MSSKILLSKNTITVNNINQARKIDKTHKYQETIIHSQNNTWFGFSIDDALNHMIKHNPNEIPQSFEFRKWL